MLRANALRTLLLALILTLAGCPEDSAPETLVLSITSDAPRSGDELDFLRILFFQNGQAVPADLEDPAFNMQLNALQNPVTDTVVVKVAYGAATFADSIVTLRISGFLDGAVETAWEGTVDLTERKIIDVHLASVAADCDVDGDGFLDCTIDGCCGADASLSDCQPDDPTSHPWAEEPECEPCDDVIDNNCDGEDVPCIDADEDGLPDCQEIEACGADSGAENNDVVGPGMTELCDDFDNDCNGQTNEGYALVNVVGSPQVGESCGFGACGGGKVECVSPTESACVSDFEPTSEDCGADGGGNGVDEDCDGIADEGCDQSDLDGDGFSIEEGDCQPADSSVFPRDEGYVEPCCLEGTPIEVCDKNCDGEVTPCAATDLDGDGSPTPNDCDDTDPLVHPAAPEKCGDGVDQDCIAGDQACDGLIDEDGDGWSPPTDCDDGDDDIHPGAIELCDAIDNDCNGFIDDGNPEASGEGTNQPLACGSDIGECAKGLLVCANGGGFDGTIECVLEDLPTTDLCDDLDNDCDGLTDEDFGPDGEAQLVDLDGTEGLKKGNTCGVGACAGGDVVCGPGLAALTCTTHPLKTAEICDGIDNDCDGLTDEDFGADGSVKYADLDGTTGLVLGDACGAGVCGGGEVVCHPDQATLTCSTLFEVDVDVCDGLDNDCDGVADEDYKTGGSVTYTDPGGAAGLVLEDSCGVGECAGGAVQCAPDKSSLTCSTLGAVAEDVCDGLDNDCDGQADEAYKAGGSVTYTDLDGTAGLVLAASCGVGECADGVVECAGDQSSLTCSTLSAAAQDICDGLDNDCDGQADEDYKTGGAVTFKDLDGTAGLVLDDGCGVGECAGGGVVCAPDGHTLECSSHDQAAQDVCDALDNDCDGDVDEDYKAGGAVTLTDLNGDTGLQLTDSCGVGICGGGTVVCGDDKASLACDSHDNAVVDLCNGLDDDCDGEEDEDFVTGGTVTLTDLDGTSGLVKDDGCGVGECADGTVVCSADGTALECTSHDQAAPDLCDALDNDCDGVADEDFIADGTITLTDLDGTAGLVKDDDCGAGECSGGSVVCSADGTGLECNSHILADVDLCDGDDNDCNGVVDDDFIETGSVKFTDADGTGGLFVGSACGVGVCAGGEVVCTADGTGLECDTHSALVQDICDGLDNDCDGVEDEDFKTGGGVSFTDADGTADLVLDDGCGVGVCASGTVQCAAGGASLECSTHDNISLDVCDGLDNDCDGVEDEDFKAGGSVSFTDADGTAALVLDDGCGVGVCAAGSVQCAADGASLECSTHGNISLDVCDGLDNDCDGVEDEDYKAGGSVTFDDLDGDTGLVLADECGSGLCGVGAVECAPGGVTLRCSTHGAAVPDLCDGIDNDCDGETDEDFIAGGTIKLQDFDGTERVKGEGCGTGECSGGEVVCSADGLTLVCDSAGNAEADRCDGLDNDCDGTTDQDFITGGTIALTDADGTSGLVKGDDCGVGLCTGGEVVCTADGAALECDRHDFISPDICDGQDNDCDGTTDESFIADGSVKFKEADGTDRVKGDGCGVGECAGGEVVCSADGNQLVCDSGGNASPDVCDGLDNDCDGTTDEAFIADGEVVFEDFDGSELVKGDDCGTGACGGGEVVCSADGNQLECDTADLATPERCDGIDNDCDGEDNEDFVAGGTVKFEDFDGSELELGAVCGTGLCSDGLVECSDDGQRLECSTAGNAVPDICDGDDNDCDGEADEDFVSGGSVSFDDLDGTTGLVLGDACGAGECGTGAVVCGGDGVTLVCNVHGLATAEVCDGDDNDCDGDTDEDFVAGGAVTFDDLDGTTGLSLGDDCGVGFCTGGEVVCRADGGGMTCDRHSFAVPDICDGQDNDCDGEADEDYLADGFVKFVDYDGSQLVKNEGCGTGACESGTVVCTSDGNGLDCSTSDNAVAEVCDDVDNNCDGQTDEQLTIGGDDLQRLSASGCDVAGVCSSGTTAVCNGGDWDCFYPAAREGSSETTCDSLDNDCDGETDEALVLTDNGDLTSAGCDVVGACASGTTATCVDGAFSCHYGAATFEAGDEVSCDNVDNDCDGSTDESITVSGDNQALANVGCDVAGICATGTSATCNAGSFDCSYPGAREGDLETLCDGADNDCDGLTDEELTLTSNGDLVAQGCDVVGACASGTTAECVGGDYQCVYGAAAFEADTEVSCDNVDNDCDGSTDESITVSGDLQELFAVGCDVAGVCSSGTSATCNAGSFDCTYPVAREGSTETSCDGADNDCDGEIDEDLLLTATVDVQAQGCLVAGVCSVGTNAECISGGYECIYTAANYEADDEVSCDNADNDCDGATDESIVLTGIQALAAEGCLVAGVCGTGTTATCGAGSFTCDYPAAREVGEETLCDSLDNDCDGATDEPFLPGGSITFTDYDDVELGLGQACGVNACVGTVVCDGDPAIALTCDGLVNATTETCDGTDEDCTGVADDNLDPGTDNDCETAGVCGEGVNATCNGGSGWGCAYTSLDYGEDPEDEFFLCDELDNDCDGNTDETCDGLNTGSGTCRLSATHGFNFCDGCTADAECGAGFVCVNDAAGNFCAMGCAVETDCDAAPFGTDWSCANVGGDNVCLKDCNGADINDPVCDWDAFFCSAGNLCQLIPPPGG